MYEDFVPERLAKLRTQKGVSARDMSLSLGQANNYINNIENKKSLPAMQSFFYGLAAIVFVAAIIALCSGVKAAMKKLLKGGQNHDDQQKAHRHGS